MPDILILWNKPLLWNRLFREYGMSSSSALPETLLSSHLPPAKLILIPAGFLSDQYTTAAASFTKEKVAGKLIQYVENGGTLLVFSPKMNEPVSFSWLNLPVIFVPENMPVLRPTFLSGGESFFCDGWFQNTDESCTVTETDDKGRPVHLFVQKGKGQIILSSVHEFLSESYFLSLLTGRKVKI